MSNCDNCIFRGQWCEKENKCPLVKEDPESEEEPEAIEFAKEFMSDAIHETAKQFRRQEGR